MRIKVEYDAGRKEREFKATKEVIVQERPKSNKDSKEEITAKTMCCCCVPKGETEFKVYFQKSAYFLGDTCNLVCEIDNTKCSAPCTGVTARLLHTVTYESKQGRKTASTTTVCSKEFKGIDAEKAATGDDARMESFDIETKRSKKKNKALVNCSSYGNSVTSEYTIQVACTMDACCNGCCNAIPQVAIPVHIYPMKTPPPPLPFQSNWAPTTLPPVTYGGIAYPPPMPNNPM